MNTASQLATTPLSPGIQGPAPQDSASCPASRNTFRAACVRGALVGLVGVILLFYPLIGDATKLWADDFDARLIGWIVEWGYHCMFQNASPTMVWDANSFFPHSHSLAFSDSLLGLQPFYGPLRLLGLQPIHALYGALAGVVMAGTVALSIAIHRLPHGRWQAGEQQLFLFGSLFSLSTTSFLYHYQLFGMYVAIPAAAFLFNYVCSRRFGDLGGALFCAVWAISIATYAAPMLGALLVCCSPLPLWRLWCDREALVTKRYALVWHALGAAVVGCGLYLVQLRPYLEIQRRFPSTSGLDEAYTYAARWSSFFVGYSRNSYWYRNYGYAAYGDWERVLFPGYVLVAGVGCGGLYLLVRAVAGALSRVSWLSGRVTLVEDRPDSEHSFPRELLAFVGPILLLAAVVVLSFGPYAEEQRLHRLPFYFLTKIVPGLESVRTPGRFGMFLGAPCILITILLLRKIRGYYNRLAARLVLGILLVLEGLPLVTTSTAPPVQLERAQLVAATVPQGQPVVVLPLVASDHIATMQSVISQLHEGFLHWRPLVVGYGNKTTPELSQLLDLDNQLRAGQAGSVQRLVDWAQSLAIHHIVINQAPYPALVKAEFSALLGNGALVLKKQTGDLVAYSF